MLKRILNIILLSSFIIILSGCEKFLERAPLDSSATGSFVKNEYEIDAGLMAIYRSVNWDYGLVLYQSSTDPWSYLAISRAKCLGDGSFDRYTSHPASLWQ